MKIEIDTDATSPAEYTALIALFASLGGRLPDAAQPREIGKHEALGAPYATPRPTGSANSGEVSNLGDTSNDRDSQGLPWDERIHASTKARNADGTWRQKRNVSEVLVEQVTAELQAGTGAPPAAQADEGNDDTPPPPTTEQDDTPPPPATTVAVGTASPAAGATTAASYPEFMTRLSRDVKAKGIDYKTLDQQAQMFGLSKFTELSKNVDKVPEFAAHLEAMGLLTPLDA